MKLPPPLDAHLRGTPPTHGSLASLGRHLARPQEEVTAFLRQEEYLTTEGKITRRALVDGLVDTCEGKPLWRVARVRSFLEAHKPSEGGKTSVRPSATAAKRGTTPPVRTEPAWVDLDTVGTYFAVGKVQVGRWLDQLGMRAAPEVERNERGEVDMLAMANQAKEKQAKGFLSKEPTERALQAGVARKLPLVGKGGKEFEVTQWNLDLTKALLVRAGHELDTEHTWALKGKGRNSNVKVGGVEARARELYSQWAKLYKDPRERWRIPSLFRGQPTALLELVEAEMKMPGYLTSGRYQQDC